MKTIKPNKGCKTLLGIGSPLKFTQNDEHDIVKQAMECLNNFNRKSAGYQLGLIEGYAKSLDDVKKTVNEIKIRENNKKQPYLYSTQNLQRINNILEELRQEIAKLAKLEKK